MTGESFESELGDGFLPLLLLPPLCLFYYFSCRGFWPVGTKTLALRLPLQEHHCFCPRTPAKLRMLSPALNSYLHPLFVGSESDLDWEPKAIVLLLLLLCALTRAEKRNIEGTEGS